MTTTNDALREWAEIAGVSIGAADGGPYPTIEQLAQFAALAQQAALVPQSTGFLTKTNREYAAWCATYYQPEFLDELGMKSLDGLWAWQEQERRMLSASPAMQDAEKPDPLKKLTRLTEEMGLYPQQQAQEPDAAKHEQQAQAGEPDWSNSDTGPLKLWKNPLRPMAENLQVADGAIHHRDMIIRNLRERIAKKDAALKACVEALEIANTHVDGYYMPRGETMLTEVKAAITQAQEALK